METLWLVVAFGLGYIAKRIGLPPMIGFLISGFVLSSFGVESGDDLEEIANLGILLLLFSIGLKLKVKELLKPIVWAGTTIDMLLSVVLLGSLLFIISLFGLSEILDLTLPQIGIVAFGLSFSSTVFAIKILEAKGTNNSFYGKTAISVLVMQDVLAVLFLTFSLNKIPSPWALTIPILFLIVRSKPVVRFLDSAGHGELLVLLGLLLPVAGAFEFELVGLKPDLGALVFGMLLANHPKAKELSKAMLSFKDLFLVGFFLTIGLSGVPTWEMIGIALLLVALLPLKVGIYFLVFSVFKLKAKTSFLSSATLSNYSEFGLIVGSAALAAGWISSEWVMIFAIALSVTFVLATVINMRASSLFAKWSGSLLKLQSKERLPEEKEIELGDTQVLILGMGGLGRSVYDRLKKDHNLNLLGVDVNKEVVEKNIESGRNAILGDATDSDFWERLSISEHIEFVMLATPNHAVHLTVVDRLSAIKSDLKVATICRYEDEKEELEKLGVPIVFNLYTEAGSGFAQHSYAEFLD